MKNLLLFLASLPLLALQNGDFSGTNQLNFTGPAVSLTDYRIEGRFSGFSAAGAQGIFGANVNGPHCHLVTGTVTLRCRDFSGAGDQVDISLTGRTDVRFRFQRFYSTGVRLLEVWNSDGTGYTSGSITNAVATIAFNGTTQYVGAYFQPGSECACEIGFARWWTTTVAPASSAPPDTLLLGYADLVDIELEGNTNDSSTNAVTVTTTGGALAYSTTTLYPPSAIITFTGAARAGATYALSGASSSNLTTDTPLTYFWQAPVWTTAAPTFSTRTASATSVTIPTAQTVTVRLRVTDGIGQAGVGDYTVGSVATDANSVVIQSDATITQVLGQNLRSGAAPWTWFDQKEQAVANAIIATRPAFEGNATLTGTVAVTNGSSTLTGTGTDFAGEFACDGSDNIVLHYPIDGGGGATGRRTYVVTSCAGTSMGIYPAYDASSNASGVQFGRLTNAENASWLNGSNNWNYYDAVTALYRLYYRTGDTTYRTQARSLADAWWQYPIDGCRAWEYGQGTWQLQPRIMAVMGLMLRANDGRPEIWTQLMNCVSVPYTNLLSNRYAFQPNQDIAEIREQGYAFLFTVLASILNPDAPTRATWAANADLARDYFIANQTGYGGWTFSLGANQNYYGSGNFPWQGFPLMQAMRLEGSPTALASLKAYVDYIIAEGIDLSNDGGFYEDSYFTWCPDYSAERTGTVTATNGSASVTGSGTLFQTQYACNGTDTIAIQDSSGFRRGYTVASCASETAMTLATTYAGSTEGGLRILKYAGAGTTPPSACHVSYGTDPANMSAARTLNNGIHWGFGWAYDQYGTGSYLTLGDTLFAQNLGLDGPGNDGVVGHYADVVSGGTAPSYLAATYLSKEYAFVGGAPGSQSYLADRVGGVAPETTTSITVKVRRSAVPTATKVRVTITQPSGAALTNTCSADTCTVSGLDTRQGSTAQMRLEYLDAGDVVKASGDQQRVPVV